jgi:hypothetical protein
MYVTIKEREHPRPKLKFMCSTVETCLDLSLLTADRFAHFLSIILEEGKELSASSRSFVSPNFYKILRYVVIPDLEAMRHSSSFKGIGSMVGQEITTLLDWLRQKGVQKIIELRVHDSWKEPYSEEAIIKALVPFAVEILDWRRVDLSIRTTVELYIRISLGVACIFL